MSQADWQAFEREHVWHPYASMLDAPPAYAVAGAEGVELELTDGRRLIDGMASWWCAIHGYNHPVLNEAVRNQLDSMAHVMFGGLTHEPAARLAEKLVRITPEPLQYVFFSDSGSVSVEVAIKMALQYWQAQGHPEKHRLLTIRNGYHGDTFGAMAVCDPVNGMHHLFTHVLPQHIFADAPAARSDDAWQQSDIADFEAKIRAHRHELAAVILEPVVQGAGGMRIYAPEFLRRVRALCDELDLLLIADEIATGFGRTGKLFACEHAGIAPDILCLGKALTGGYMSFAATMVNRKVRDGIHADGSGVLMHGPTFMANPLACSVANASIDILLESSWQQRVEAIELQLQKALMPCMDADAVADVRVLGAIGVVEMKQPLDMRPVTEKLVARGVWLRPFGKLLYTMPPYIISDGDLSRITAAMRDVAGI